MPLSRTSLGLVLFAAAWLLVAVVLLFVHFMSDAGILGWTATTYLIAVVFTSGLGFMAYGWDKRKAKTSKWRIREKTLHLWALFGGWPGCLLGQQLFRHKTQKRAFQAVFWAIVLLHIIAALWWMTRGDSTAA